MEENTQKAEGQASGIEKLFNEIENHQILAQDWETTQKGLGIDLEKTAREAKAIQRVREIRSAKDLLRLNLFYAMSDWGLRLTGVWAFLCGIGCLSDVAIYKRLRNSRAWLGQLVGIILAKRCMALSSLPRVRLRLIDATCLSHPGSDGADWRIHMSYDLSNLCIDRIEVTDRYGGESLARFPTQANEIIIADSGYAFASGIGPILASKAGLVVRINWRNVRIYAPEKHRFHIIPWLKTISGPCEQPVLFETPQGWFPLRLIAAPIPPQKAASARRRVRERYLRRQKQVSQETLFAAGFVLLLTNLPSETWPACLTLFLYQTRWQVEIVFKRLKSLLHFDNLCAKDAQLAQTYIFSKILIALILDQTINQVSSFQPEWFVAFDRPANLSRFTSFFLESLKQIIFGPHLLRNLPPLYMIMRRYFCDPPRLRSQQLVLARIIFQFITRQYSYPLS